MTKQCEWCKEEFETKRSRYCGDKCRLNGRRNKSLQYSKIYRQKNSATVREYESRRYINRGTERYDTKDCLVAAQKSRKKLAKLQMEPERWAHYLAKRRDYSRNFRARKKKAVAIAAWRADPNNAARAEADGIAKMTPEERDKWWAKIEAEQEKADRKARREALKKELAAAGATANVQQDPTWADLEWAP